MSLYGQWNSVKLNPILNFVFNKNLEEIFELKKKFERFTIEVKGLENKVNRFGFICGHVNDNLRKVNLSIVYNRKIGYIWFIILLKEYKKVSIIWNWRQ